MVSSLLQTLPPIAHPFAPRNARPLYNEKDKAGLRLPAAAERRQRRHDSLHTHTPRRSRPFVHTEDVQGRFVVVQLRSIHDFVSVMLHAPSVINSRLERQICCPSTPAEQDTSSRIPATEGHAAATAADHLDAEASIHPLCAARPPDVFDLWSSSWRTPGNSDRMPTVAPPPPAAQGHDALVTTTVQRPQAQQAAPLWTRTHSYARDMRANADGFRMLAAELDMVRASKITRPLRNRHWLEKRNDTFVWGRRTCLRIVSAGEANKAVALDVS